MYGLLFHVSSPIRNIFIVLKSHFTHIRIFFVKIQIFFSTEPKLHMKGI